jgi:hypothetical protein
MTGARVFDVLCEYPSQDTVQALQIGISQIPVAAPILEQK